MGESKQRPIDVEFVTDHEADAALLNWSARRRRALVPGRIFLLVVGIVALTDIVVLWRHDRDSIAFLAAMILQIVAFGIAAIARDPDRAQPLPYPHAELLTLGLLAVSFVVTFGHHSSPLALALLVVTLVVFALVVISAWRGIAFVRRMVPDYGRAVHVHLDDDGVEVTIRPRPHPRRIPWKSVRYLGSDAQSLFIVAGVEPVLVPRRAFPRPDVWDEFVAAAAEQLDAALRSRTRGRRDRSAPEKA